MGEISTCTVLCESSTFFLLFLNGAAETPTVLLSSCVCVHVYVCECMHAHVCVYVWVRSFESFGVWDKGSK